MITGLSVIVVNFNTGDLLRACIGALRDELPDGSEVLVVDNASSDGSADRLEGLLPNLAVIRNPRNVGFGRANNQALRISAGERVLFLNPDTVLAAGSLRTGLRYLDEHPDVGVLGARVVLPDGELDPAARRAFKRPRDYFYKAIGVNRGYYLTAVAGEAVSDIDSTVGAFMLMPRHVLDAVGAFDERFYMYCEDEDLCWRVKRAGWRVVHHPGVTVFHRKGSSTRQRRARMLYHFHRSLFLYHRKNLASEHPRIVNWAVYAGIAASLAIHTLAWSPRALVGRVARGNVKAAPRHRGAERAAKRAIDVVVAGVALLVLSPVLAGLALLVRTTSPGPVFYRWAVVGQGGRPFISWKFRTMVENADALKPDLALRNEMRGPVFKIGDDPRVTPVGRILRRFSVDELPQLWSVLKGEMSLVGPRPPLQSEYAHFTPEQRRKLAVKPGITCLWQISGRNRIADFDEWLRLDLEYIERWSLGLDLRILVRTIPAALSGHGAS